MFKELLLLLLLFLPLLLPFLWFLIRICSFQGFCWFHRLDLMWNNLPIHDLIFVHIFKNTRANTHTPGSLCNSRGSRTSVTDLLVPLRTRTLIINNQICFLYESNQTKDLWSEVGRGGGTGGGFPHSTAHCGLRRTASELRNQNRNRIQHQNLSFKIISMNYRKVRIKSDKNRQIVGQLGGPPLCVARARARANMIWTNTRFKIIEIIHLNI